MSLVVTFTPSEEAEIFVKAKTEGLEPTQFVKKLVHDYEPPISTEEAVMAKLRKWQEEDGTPLRSATSGDDLYNKFCAALTTGTDEERHAVLSALAESEGTVEAESLESPGFVNKPFQATPTPPELKERVREMLRKRREQTKTPDMPHVSAHEHFARLEAEAAQMTDKELEAEGRLWETFMINVNKTRAELGMRLL